LNRFCGSRTKTQRKGTANKPVEYHTGLTPDEQTIFAYATAASSTIACSYSSGLR
jgi:hypothetical protein